MQVSVEMTRGVERRMTVEIQSENLKPQIQKRLQSLAHESKINGFRPGKVPMLVVEQRYGQKVREEIAGEVIQTSFNQAIAQKQLNTVNNPTFDVNSDIRNLEQGLSYTAVFEIYPDLTTLHVDGLAVEMPVAEITDADVDALLDRLRQQRQTWNDVDRLASDGDRLIINFVGSIDGKPFKDSEFKQVPLFLGKKDFILPDFEDKLMGAKRGDEREFDLTFSKEHKNPALAGHTVHFVVQVSKVSEPQVPEINEEFIKSFGVENGRLEALRADTRRNMERELKYVTEEKVKQQILGALLRANPIDEIPQSLLEDDMQRLLKTRQQEWQTQNLNANMFKEEARQRVKIGLLVNELMNRYHIQVDPDKVRRLIENMASVYKDPQAVVQKYYADQQRLKEVESMVLENEVVAWLLKRAQITEKKTDFFSVVET